MEYICRYCGKECKNDNSLRQHEIRCKENPNKIDTSYMKYAWINYNNKVKSGDCIKKHTNQFTKAKELGYTITISDETRKKIAKGGLSQVWDEERRHKHSIAMRRAVAENPDSYSSSNVNGRVRHVKYKDIMLDSKWEVIVAKFLDEHNIKWLRPSNSFEYFWNNSYHSYYPDFYLEDYDTYIEVKGYIRDRDYCKWKVVNNLIVITRKEIKEIESGSYRLCLINS